MKRMWQILVVVGAVQLSSALAHAQIRYLTVRAPHNPVPPMALLPATDTPVAVNSSVSVKVVARPRVSQDLSFDKAGIEKRVLAFQQQRAREGSASAQYDLAMRYLKGDGVEKDVQRARQWLTTAAKGSSPEARRQLEQLDSTAK
jgi:TPR repeat protein